MNIYSKGKDLIIDNIRDFSIDDILLCGQCFNFEKINDYYKVIAYKKCLYIKQEDEKLILKNTSKNDYFDIWEHYFDMEKDYSLIKKQLIKADPELKKHIDTHPGIRILNQEFFETLISFIISQNKQIPHIKQIVKNLSQKYGEKINCFDEEYFTFPEVDKMINVTQEQIRETKVGFRAPYIMDAVSKVYNKEIIEKDLKILSNIKAREKLMNIKGVGEKVANCVLLFSIGKREAFPIDVWMKRIMEEKYFSGEDIKKDKIEKFGVNLFGSYSGYAQQYLFYYGREKIKKNNLQK